jgi:hypothetical protein
MGCQLRAVAGQVERIRQTEAWKIFQPPNAPREIFGLKYGEIRRMRVSLD